MNILLTKNRLQAYICSLVCLFCSTTALAIQAQDPVKWSISAERTGAGAYILDVKGTIAPGWHLYAETESAEGLEGIIVTADHEGAVSGKLQWYSQPDTLQDALFNNMLLKVHMGKIHLQQDIRIIGTVPASLDVVLTAYASNGGQFLPVEKTFHVELEGGITPDVDPAASLLLASAKQEQPVASCGTEQEATGDMALIFLLGFIGGLLALLTPCVFPMIPLTVTFFTSRSKKREQVIRNGLLFGFFILMIYLTCSLPFHLLDSVEPGIFNSLSTNVWVNLFFFVIFVVFALSFFGLFDLTLPGGFTNKVDSKGGLGSLGGIFFLALTLGVVSFSCTGPILGSLLVGSLSSDNGAWQLTAGMAGFGFALALPFAAFAMFPGWLQLMPRSGGWLDTVKKSLAFVELALALKFLSNADLVAQWGLLKREVFIGIWILLAISLALYLFGAFRFPGDPARQGISQVRKVMGVLVLVFALYIAPGLGSAASSNLQLLSGFPPPQSYSVYARDKAIKSAGGLVEPQVVNNFEAAVQLAKNQGKPLLIDFTGWACVNCRKMEEQVWSDPEIAKLIKEEFVLVSLYVDDREQLSASERFTYTSSDGYTKEIRTMGDKWATFQAINFGQVTQPLYVILSPDEELLNKPVGYTPDENAYKVWLQCGLNEFRSGSALSSSFSK